MQVKQQRRRAKGGAKAKPNTKCDDVILDQIWLFKINVVNLIAALPLARIMIISVLDDNLIILTIINEPVTHTHVSFLLSVISNKHHARWTVHTNIGIC